MGNLTDLVNAEPLTELLQLLIRHVRRLLHCGNYAMQRPMH
jgi:hypothetical protein